MKFRGKQCPVCKKRSKLPFFSSPLSDLSVCLRCYNKERRSIHRDEVELVTNLAVYGKNPVRLVSLLDEKLCLKSQQWGTCIGMKAEEVLRYNRKFIIGIQVFLISENSPFSPATEHTVREEEFLESPWGVFAQITEKTIERYMKGIQLQTSETMINGSDQSSQNNGEELIHQSDISC
ncbi:MAG: hypothetical protein ACFFCQ_08350 [Promethearchaeota archaeon]